MTWVTAFVFIYRLVYVFEILSVLYFVHHCLALVGLLDGLHSWHICASLESANASMLDWSEIMLPVYADMSDLFVGGGVEETIKLGEIVPFLIKSKRHKILAFLGDHTLYFQPS